MRVPTDKLCKKELLVTFLFVLFTSNYSLSLCLLITQFAMTASTSGG